MRVSMDGEGTSDALGRSPVSGDPGIEGQAEAGTEARSQAADIVPWKTGHRTAQDSNQYT